MLGGRAVDRADGSLRHQNWEQEAPWWASKQEAGCTVTLEELTGCCCPCTVQVLPLSSWLHSIMLLSLEKVSNCWGVSWAWAWLCPGKREDLTSLIFEMRKIAHVLSLSSVLFVHSNVPSAFLNELFQILTEILWGKYHLHLHIIAEKPNEVQREVACHCCEGCRDVNPQTLGSGCATTLFCWACGLPPTEMAPVVDSGVPAKNMAVSRTMIH